MKDGVNRLIALPKGDTIRTWLYQKVGFLGIKEDELHHLENVIFVEKLIKESSSIKNLTTLCATNTHGTLNHMDVFLQMKNLSKILDPLKLAKSLGITKEGVHRLIWLFADAQNTKLGSGEYSSETISLVKNALSKERILKQTITQSDSPLSWTKSESPLTNKR